MTGIAADGRVTGVTVTDDNETAGYVDKVKKGGLFDAFRDKETTDGGFTLGEDIDGISQATKTSRGVTEGVNKAVPITGRSPAEQGRGIMAKTYLQTFSKGLVRENPVLRLVLGTCPTLAVTTAAINGLGMGAAATFVLVCSNIAISLLRKVIPDKVRLPAFIVIIAGFTTIVQMLVKAYLPDIDKALGIYLPLIVVNCIILGRAEAFASKNSVGLSALDGLGMGAASPPR